MASIALTERDGCPLCHSREAIVFLSFSEIPVVRCGQCEFMYSSKVLSEQKLSSYYENTFGSQRHLQGQIVNAKVNAMILNGLINFQDIGNILDVGTGYGFLLKELCGQYKLAGTGVELSRQEAEYGKNSLGINLVNSSLSASGLTKVSFDLVTSFEVIEHVSRPAEFIAELIEYVKPEGYLLIMTDNFESRMAKSLGAAFPKWIPHSHICHFSAATLRRTLEDTGKLKLIESLSYTPWEIVLKNACYKIFGISKMPSEAFDLESSLATEMRGTYKFFSMRRLINKIWARISISKNMDGDLMYFLCKKTG